MKFLFFIFVKWAASWQNQQNDMCAQRRLRSAWASTQSDQSSLCAQWVAKDLSFLHADSEDSDQTGRIPMLIWVFAGCTCHFVGFVTMRLRFCFKMTVTVKEQRMFHVDVICDIRWHFGIQFQIKIFTCFNVSMLCDVTLTLHATHCVHTSMNLRKNEIHFLARLNNIHGELLYYPPALALALALVLASASTYVKVLR